MTRIDACFFTVFAHAFRGALGLHGFHGLSDGIRLWIPLQQLID